MIDTECGRGASIHRWVGGAGLSRCLAALAFILAVLYSFSLSASAAEPPPPFPERDVTVEFVRVLPPGGASKPGAMRFHQLSPAARAMLKQDLPDPERKLYIVPKKQTIHLGGPQLVRTGPREELEFRRIGIHGGSVECASLVDGVVMVSGAQSSKELSEKPYLCGGYDASNSDIYVVAWVPKKTPAQNR
jgi:hypothetical protein